MGGRRLRAAAAFAAAFVSVAPAAAMTGGAGRSDSVRRLTRAQRLDFVWPAQGTITTPFTRHHHGVDIGMLRSFGVRAAAPGRVVDAGVTLGFKGYGRIVLVQVTPDVVTLYAHLRSYRV